LRKWTEQKRGSSTHAVVLCAVKVYALAALSDQADTANFHIVRYHQAWIEDDRLYIQTELCSGTLADEVSRDGQLSVSRTYKLLREILLALDFIHRHNMVHLDIKPENIFLKNDQYKLGDFGLVTKLSASQDVEEGDSRYMSLELLSGDRNCDLTKSDVFSLGATMYELCLRRPLPMNGQEWQDIRAGRLSEDLDKVVDAELASIIRRMMDVVSLNRPSPLSLLKHPQLLSDEQKALNVEKSKVIQANLQLAAQQQRFGEPPKRRLMRSNTWNGSAALPYM
jgi:wee1-like protein kinase